MGEQKCEGNCHKEAGSYLLRHFCTHPFTSVCVFFSCEIQYMFSSPSRKSIIARWYFPEENKTDHRETRFSGPVWGLEDNFLGGGWGQESRRRVLLRQLDDSQYLERFLLKHLLISADLPEKTPCSYERVFFLSCEYQ